MSENVIAIYCFLDDSFLEVGTDYSSLRPQAKPKVSDSIVLTTAIISARFFYSNQATSMNYMVDSHKVDLLPFTEHKDKEHPS